ncbi:MAG: Ig-like domain-containing protein [Nitrospirae bacterium]|nr:Ig-like domain-containing protein [Nitrospirota bacterium]
MKKLSDIIMKQKFFIILTAVLSLYVITGCSNKTDRSSVTSPNPDTLNPTGIIQGVLRDAVTQQPIVGAVVDIGVGRTTTSETGQFTINDVPATGSSGDGIPKVNDSYEMTIDLRNVTSPVNMTSATTTPRYPDFVYDTMPVTYTSLNDTTNDNDLSTSANSGSGTNSQANTTSTNHDTPVTGLASAGKISVGKLAATITGVVAYSDTKQPVDSGWTVEIVSNSSSNSEGSAGGTGASGNVVGSTTTIAGGVFTFPNIESMQSFTIKAWNSDQTYSNGAGLVVVSPSDSETKTLSVQAGTTVLVASTDATAPTIISVSPENNADITPAATNVVYTFSEPIKQTAYAAATTAANSQVSGLYKDVAVNYDGIKASNIAHTLSWSTDFKSLTVSIPTLAPSARYSVNITGVTLVDSSDTAVSNLGAKGLVAFTTNGGATASAPTVTLVNNTGIDYSGVNPVLDWLPVSGAKSYNIYRAMNQVWGSTINSGAYKFVNTSNQSDFTDTTIPDNDGDGYTFIEDRQTMLTYSYVVKSVNSDFTESDGSAAVTAEDKVKPKLDIAAGAFVADIKDENSTITLSFNEPMDESSVETAGNYVISVASGTAPTVSSAVYTLAAPYNVALTLSGSLTQNTLGRTISTGANGILQSVLAAGDTYLNTANQTAITAGTNGVLNSTPCDTDGNGAANGACDDVVVGTTISSGPNGVIESVVLTGSDDVQALPFSANVSAIRGMNTATVGDDTVTNATVITVSNVKDVAGNTIDTTGDVQDTAGAVQ